MNALVEIDLTQFFDTANGTDIVRTQNVARSSWNECGVEYIRDDFDNSGAQCLFVRSKQSGPSTVEVRLDGNYRLKICALGGWLLHEDAQGELFWMPQPPSLRALDADAHIISEKTASSSSFGMTSQHATITFPVPESYAFDWTIWRLDSTLADWVAELDRAATLECQPYFIYASHTTTSCAADCYRHLIHGHVYGSAWAWPKKRKICDELDAYALYLIAAALERSTGKVLYRLMRQQLSMSVVSRQEKDGGFRHGEWTNRHESHNRLINGAIQLLASEVEDTGDPVLIRSLRDAAGYLARQVDHTDAGVWFLHDSLELSEESMCEYPFSWIPSTWMGKSRTNLLILNTHLDCMLALKRYQVVSSDLQYDELLASAQRTLTTALMSRPANWLYKPLMRIIGLTLLPKVEQERLSLPVRALKRSAWKYLIPKWHLVRNRFPRFVMPGGYIERSLNQKGFAHRYHAVHLMDFVRYLHHFTAPHLEHIPNELVKFGASSQVIGHWKESPASRDSLGFWAEGLFQLCARSRTSKYRELLASTVIDLADAGLGLPPSLLGANAELVSREMRTPCPSPADPGIRIVNLTVGAEPEFLAINTTHAALPIRFDAGEPPGLIWTLHDAGPPTTVIPPRGWLTGSQNSAAASEHVMTSAPDRSKHPNHNIFENSGFRLNKSEIHPL